jgi:hypothetical protein
MIRIDILPHNTAVLVYEAGRGVYIAEGGLQLLGGSGRAAGLPAYRDLGRPIRSIRPAMLSTQGLTKQNPTDKESEWPPLQLTIVRSEAMSCTT